MYAADTIQSLLPSTASPHYFCKDGDGGTPGIVTYAGTSLILNSSAADQPTLVSTKKWNVAKEIYTSAPSDFYTSMLTQFLGTPMTADASGPTSWIAKPSVAPVIGSAYYINGSISIDDTDWSVGIGESIVVFVNGSLIISRKIILIGTGFVAFIVNGNLNIDTSVGGSASDSTLVVEGVYIMSLTGTLSIPYSSDSNTARFIWQGIFITDNF